MAYIVSPYAGAAEFPSDNMPAQLLQQGLQAGYARRMKEMEQKMKLKEEGKKSLDEAYKYAKLDLSKVHPIYQNELLSESNAVTKEAAEAFLKDPTTFAYDTEIADKIGKLNTKKSIYEQRSAFINKDEEAKRQFEKEGKFDVAPTEFGNLMNEYKNPETKPERKKQIEIYWKDNFADANLYTTKLRVAPYTWDDVAQEVKNLKPQTDKRKITYPQKETVIATVINDPNKKASLATQAGIDISTKEGENELIKRLESYMSESEKPAPQRANFYPSGGFYETKNVSIGEGTIILPSASKAKSEWEQIASKLEEFHNEGIKRRGLDPLDYPFNEEPIKKRFISNWLKTHKTPTTFHSVEYKGTAENPNAPILNFNVDGVVYRGSPQGFEVDKNKKITHISIYEEPKLDKRGDVVSGGNITTIKATPEAWEKYSNAYGLSDFVRRYNLIKPSSATSATKESERKDANESKKVGFTGGPPKRKM